MSTSNRRASVSPSDIVVQNQINAAKKENAKDAKVGKKPKWIKMGYKFMDSGEVQLFLGVLLMISLFLSDAWILGNSPDNQDEGMWGVLMFVVVVFSAEVVALSIFDDKYFNSFFFWMDFLGTLSILLDIGWVAHAVIGNGGGDSASRGSVLRATRAAKLGARYGRILRLMKLMKLTHMCPCMKDKNAEEAEAEPTLSAVVRISGELTGTISRRVALLVVTIVIVVPFLSYTVTDYSQESWLQVLKTTAKSNNCSNYDVERFIYKYQRFYHFKDIHLKDVTVQSPWKSCGGVYHANGTLDPSATQTTYYHEYGGSRTVTKNTNLIGFLNDLEGKGEFEGNYMIRSTMDYTVPNQWNSFYGIILMILVIGVLFGFSASFHTSIATLVVNPLQKLMGTLRKSATMMLDALKSLEKEKKQEEKKAAEKDGKEIDIDSDDEEDEDEEAAMLENLVEKLAKIVKHVLPANNDIVDLKNENVDKATADWLNQQYTSNNNNNVREEKPLDIASLGVVTEGAELTSAEMEELAFRKQLTDRVVSLVGSKSILDTFDFDVLNVKSNEECTDIVQYIVDVNLGCFSEFKVPRDVFVNFSNTLASRYINENTYHHFRHAVDVFHTTYRLLMMAELTPVSLGGSGAMSLLEVFSVLIAALGHDVGHPAVNNGFLVKSKHTLAFQHNDKSPLENMHCVVLYEILQQSSMSTHIAASSRNTADNSMTKESSVASASPRPAGDCNIFVGLSESQWRESRKVILACILGTDMIHHFDQVKKTNLFNDLNNESIYSYYSGEVADMECLKDNNNRYFIMELLLHSSDISNPFKPFDICAKWADLVMAEFFAQGDQERALGFDISPGFDRNVTNIFNMQMGFIEFVVAPLIGGKVE